MSESIAIPQPALDAGMTNLVFDEEFENYDKIDMEVTGNPGYNWYLDRPYGGSPITAEELTIKNSVMTFKPHTCGASIGISTYSKKGRTGFMYQFGYAEARMRYDDPVPGKPRNGWPAFWGWYKEDWNGEPWVRNNGRAGELDILETALAPVGNESAYGFSENNGQQGDGTHMIYTGSLHDRRRYFPDGRLIEVNGKQRREEPACSNMVVNCGYLDQWHYMDSEWHTYAALWEPGYIAWYLDGHRMHATRFAEGELPKYYYLEDETPLPPHEWSKGNFPGGFTVFNNQELLLVLGAHENWPIEVDWVRVWQK